MYDNVKLIFLANNLPQHLLFGSEPFTHYGLKFIPLYSKKEGEIYGFRTWINNLKLEVYRYNSAYCLENSLHKFSMGNNHSDFTKTKFIAALKELSHTLQENIFEADIKQLEVGCNIIVPDANAAWKNLGSYKGKAYLTQTTKKGQGYGALCKFDNYVLKAYNKTMQVDAVDKQTITENLLRVEVVYTKMAALHNRKEKIRLYKVKDLFEPEIMQQLSEDVLTKYRDSLKNQIVIPTTLREATAYSRMTVPEAKELLRLKHKNTFDDDMAIYRKMKKKAAEGGDEIERLLTEKFNELMNC
jgi:hypothetical protein